MKKVIVISVGKSQKLERGYAEGGPANDQRGKTKIGDTSDLGGGSGQIHLEIWRRVGSRGRAAKSRTKEIEGGGGKSSRRTGTR